jgi:hypothetical protein
MPCTALTGATSTRRRRMTTLVSGTCAVSNSGFRIDSRYLIANCTDARMFRHRARDRCRIRFRTPAGYLEM